MEKINFRPINDRILAEQVYEEFKTQETGGLITGLEGISAHDLTDQKKLMEKLNTGRTATNMAKVLRVGVNVKEIKEGDLVNFSGRKMDIKHDQKEYIVFKEEDVNGVIEQHP